MLDLNKKRAVALALSAVLFGSVLAGCSGNSGSTNGTTTAIERSILINGEVPFDEADRILFERIFEDSNKDYKTVEGNQSFPSQVEAPRWNRVRVYDQNRYFTEPLKFYLEEGSHTLTLDSVKEPMAIRSIRFVPSDDIPSYAEYRKARGERCQGSRRTRFPGFDLDSIGVLRRACRLGCENH